MIIDPLKLEYQTHPPPKHRRLFPVIAAATFAAVGLLALVLPPRARPNAGAIRCASNLRIIGQGILLYNNDYAGAYPPSLQALISTEGVYPQCLVCPDSGDVSATGPTTQATETAASLPGHCSFTYLGAGLTTATATASTVVAYESVDNHPKFGRDVLFGDGYVRPVPSAWFKQLETLVQQRSSTTQPVVLAPPP